jgi:hydrogenase maturation protease
MTGGRIMVAGIGNVFLGDDGFGVEVVRGIDPAHVPAGVDVVDYGIRGVHLAYELLNGHHDTLVLVDAIPMGEPAGTLAVIEVSEADITGDGGLDAHSMNPATVLAALRSIGGSAGRVLVVGCQPATVDQGMALSAPVQAAVAGARQLLSEVMNDEVARRRNVTV